jgi:hypothetical protein
MPTKTACALTVAAQTRSTRAIIMSGKILALTVTVFLWPFMNHAPNGKLASAQSVVILL